MKSYTFTTPTRAGMYWYLEGENNLPKIVRVFKDAQGYWSVQYDELQVSGPYDHYDDEETRGVDFLDNYEGGAWCGPIPVPPKPDWPQS